jgi:hypothetical protein
MSTNNELRNMKRRKATIISCTIAFPTYYLLKHRSTIYKSTQLMKEFYLKELLARSALGFAVGVGLSIYLFGIGPTGKNTNVDEKGEDIDKTSLEYSIQEKKGFQRRNYYLPGKIRDN